MMYPKYGGFSRDRFEMTASRRVQLLPVRFEVWANSVARDTTRNYPTAPTPMLSLRVCGIPLMT